MTILLTDDLFMHYQRCHRRAFLEVYGDSNQRQRPSDYLKKIMTDSSGHRRAILDQYPSTRPVYPFQDWDSGFRATRQLMAQGIECIDRGVLLTPYGQGETQIQLLSTPDLLIKQPGVSCFGNWQYWPVQVKLGRRPKLEYQMVSSFQALVLTQVQAAVPEQVWLMLRDRDQPYVLDLAERWEPMQDTLNQCRSALQQAAAPEVFIARNRCSLCLWFDHCYATAQEQRHLSLLPGVTPKRYSILQELGITTLETLAKTAPLHLRDQPGFGAEVARKMVDQAKASLSHTPLPNHLPDYPLPMGTPIELYFDIEAQPELNLAYLHGVLVVDRQKQQSSFHALLAEQPDQEGQAWQQFLDLVLRYPHAPIYHFCTYEAEAVKRLAKTYGGMEGGIQNLLDRFVDIHAWVTESVTLPVESYALKPIARWVGFDWRHSEANGAQAIYWYEQWLSTGDRQFLQAIVDYNEDDCRATHAVKYWLEQFLDQAVDCA
ncbi:TM0106 family RecB-like putative nuclease [Prochlorothrix hollandica]|uniref:TM0106 family RecB-like putative nuclease n=1 Tax=Prochlorothrix hollandica TaxID=1223 RepID=UPI001F1CA2C2|nr:TM0106 family RecB-like putative nuclease [Prochlorothrix hollandica]